MKRYYAIKYNRIHCEIDVAPFSLKAMDDACRRIGCNDWIELDESGLLILAKLKESRD